MVRLSEIFEVTYGTKFDFNKMNISNHEDENYINFVSRTSKNNGVKCKVAKYQNREPLEAGLITVTLGGTYLLSSFVQPEPFYTAQNVAVLKARTNLSLNEKIYYCVCIRANRFRYGAFGREANRTLRDLEVPDVKDIPSWVYDLDLSKYKHAKEPYTLSAVKINNEIKNWKWFTYEELFEVKKGKRLTKANMVPGKTPYIGAISGNNGVSDYIGQPWMHKGNTITVNYDGSVGEAFYQPRNFICSDAVNVLYPKFELNVYIAMYLITLIRKEKYRYNYGRKWHLERMRASKIKLPVTAQGEPDWSYMENYIKSLNYSSMIK